VEGAVAAQWLGGTYEQKPEVWTEAAPLTHVDKTAAAFLFVNSSIPRFHAGRDDMIRKLDAVSIYSEVHTLEDTPHPFWFFNPWFTPMMGFVTNFLDKQFGQ
jgi:pectinesterase